MEDMPMKLLIVSIVLSVTVPYIIDAYEGYSQSSTLNALYLELSRFLSDVQSIDRLGIGSTRTVEMDLSSIGSVHIDKVIIGGDLKDHKKYLPVIRIKLAGEQGYHYMITQPNVYMLNFENLCPLILQEGNWRIKITHKEAELDEEYLDIVDVEIV